MITFEYLKELNESGELPRKFTDEELYKIVEAESMMCGGGCVFCPMAQYEASFMPPVESKEDKKQETETKKENNNG